MENSGKVLFGDETPQWFLALGDEQVGPLMAADVYQKILKQEISWAHFVWKVGQADWTRICDTPAFKNAMPTQPVIKPALKPAAKVSPPPAPRNAKELKTWFLYYNDTQFGPFSEEEITRSLQSGKVHGRVHCWCDGMENWKRLEETPEFKSAGAPKAEKKVSLSEKTDLRAGPRRPMVAKVFISNEESLAVAVCRDVSIGGMQVLTDKIPGPVGTKVKLNVSPPGPQVKPFVAQGVIVRILEDQRGFSFRFEKLADDAKKAIEGYIAASD